MIACVDMEEWEGGSSANVTDWAVGGEGGVVKEVRKQKKKQKTKKKKKRGKKKKEAN